MQYAEPVYISPTGDLHRPQRLSLEGKLVDSYDEKSLQKLLFDNPSLLPVGELDSNYSALIPVCRELRTGTGPIDLFYVTEDGGLVLAETKLWRNPEARREVIGQILDYAKELSKLDYAKLSLQVNKSSGQKYETLYQCVAHANPFLDEKIFADAVTRNLAQGNFLLMIVGDGIREGVEELTGFLDRLGRLAFTFGLVEMALFKMPDGGRFVQPRVLAKTVIVKRSVVSIEDGRKAIVEEEGEIQEATHERSPWRQFMFAFWSDFIDNHLKLDDTSQPRPSANQSANLYLPQPPSGSQAWISAYVSQAKREVGVYFRFAKGSYGDEATKLLRAQQSEIEGELGVPVRCYDADGVYWIHTKMNYSDLENPADLASVRQFLADRTNRFVKALRSRLQTIADELG